MALSGKPSETRKERIVAIRYKKVEILERARERSTNILTDSRIIYFLQTILQIVFSLKYSQPGMVLLKS